MLVFELRRIATSIALVAVIAISLGGCGDDTEPVAADLGLDIAINQDGTGSPDAPGLTDGAADLVAADTTQLDAGKPYVYENVDVNKAWKLIQAKTYTLLDVREPSELSIDGYIAGAVNLPYTSGKLTSGYATLPKGKGIVVYCRSGNRSSKSAPFLVSKGYKPVYNVLGGFTAWKAAGLPWTK
jgi:rhodanese-related sulfurtransferase